MLNKWRLLLPQIIAIFPVAVNELCIGIGYGWVAPAVKRFSTECFLSEEEISWIASLHELGRCSSPLLAGAALNRIGRKKCLIFSSIISVAAWSIITFAKTIPVLLAFARYLFGIGVGIGDVVSGIYLSELVTADIRGKVFSLTNTVFNAGLLVGYVLGCSLDYTLFNVSILSVSMVSLISSFILAIETPQFMIARQREDAAKKILAAIRGLDCDSVEIDTEMREIKSGIGEIAEQQRCTEKSGSRKTTVKIFVMVFSICLLGRATGYHPVIYYSSTIFRDQSSLLTSDQFTILLGIFQLISIFLSTAVIDRYGRKFLLTTFSVYTIVSHSATLIVYLLQEKMNVREMEWCFQWITFGLLASYVTVYTFGYVPANFSLRAELFPHHLKGIGTATAIIGQSAMSFLTTKLFFVVKSIDGIYLNFLLYIIAAVIILLIVYFVLPETKGITLTEIQKQISS